MDEASGFPQCVKKSSRKGSGPQVDGIVLIDASRAERGRHSRGKIAGISRPKQANHRAGSQLRIIHNNLSAVVTVDLRHGRR